MHLVAEPRERGRLRRGCPSVIESVTASGVETANVRIRGLLDLAALAIPQLPMGRLRRRVGIQVGCILVLKIGLATHLL